jgi:geranylgeranyl pyrophosphate synthase
MLTIDQHVQAVYRIMTESVEIGRKDLFPDFYELLEAVFHERMPATGSPPWLMLPILTCEALGGNEDQAQHVAAALEIGRIAAGCLDEWQDLDTDDALWRAVGAERTVSLATAMIGLSFLTLSRLSDLDAPANVVLELEREFALTLLQMSGGQHADLGDNLSLDDYETVAGAKSGTLFQLGCRTGALIASATKETADLYGDYGYHLGVLIQMWNDFQGLAGVKGKMDAERKRALPVVATAALDDAEYDRRSVEGQVGDLYALVRLQAYHQRATDALDRCPAPGRLPLFLDVYSTRHLVERASRIVP